MHEDSVSRASQTKTGDDCGSTRKDDREVPDHSIDRAAPQSIEPVGCSGQMRLTWHLSGRSLMGSQGHLRRMPHWKPQGFTLVEVLVVVAIIALLLAMLLPPLRYAQDVARMIHCEANLHSLGHAQVVYCNDNRGFVPRDYNGPDEVKIGRPFFAAKFLPYIDGREIPRDIERQGTGYLGNTPADHYMYDVFKTVKPYQCVAWREEEYVVDYIVNAVDFVKYQPGRSYPREAPASRLTTIPVPPASVLHLGEINAKPTRGPTGFTANDAGDDRFFPFRNYGQPQPFSRYMTAGDTRHRGKCTVVFFDGHAEARPITADGFPVQLFNPLHPMP